MKVQIIDRKILLTQFRGNEQETEWVPLSAIIEGNVKKYLPGENTYDLSISHTGRFDFVSGVRRIPDSELHEVMQAVFPPDDFICVKKQGDGVARAYEDFWYLNIRIIKSIKVSRNDVDIRFFDSKAGGGIKGISCGVNSGMRMAIEYCSRVKNWPVSEELLVRDGRLCLWDAEKERIFSRPLNEILEGDVIERTDGTFDLIVHVKDDHFRPHICLGLSESDKDALVEKFFPGDRYIVLRGCTHGRKTEQYISAAEVDFRLDDAGHIRLRDSDGSFNCIGLTSREVAIFAEKLHEWKSKLTKC